MFKLFNKLANLTFSIAAFKLCFKPDYNYLPFLKMATSAIFKFLN